MGYQGQGNDLWAGCVDGQRRNYAERTDQQSNERDDDILHRHGIRKGGGEDGLPSLDEQHSTKGKKIVGSFHVVSATETKSFSFAYALAVSTVSRKKPYYKQQQHKIKMESNRSPENW
jgi:hypothetical protein